MRLPQRGAASPWLAAAWTALALMLGMALWGAFFGTGGPGGPPGRATGGQGADGGHEAASASAASAAVGVDRPASASASAPAGGVAAAPPSQQAIAPPAAAGSGPGEVDSVARPTGEQVLCGLGRWAPLPGAAAASGAAAGMPAELPGHLGADWLALWWPRVLAALHGGSEVQRAAALMLPATWPAFGPAAAPLPPPAHAAPAALATLARLARGSGDADVRSWAMQACDAAGLPVSCVGLSGRHAVQQAPHRAEGWRFLLAQEPQALDEALDGLARASDWSFGEGRLLRQVVQAWPPDAPVHLLPDLVMGLVAWASGQRAQGWDALVPACARPSSLTEPRRRQACERVVQRMLADGRDLMTLATARLLAPRLGGSTAALAKAAGPSTEPVALAMGLMQAVSVPAQPYGCEAVAQARRWVDAVASMGEVAALRAVQMAGPASAPADGATRRR